MWLSQKGKWKRGICLSLIAENYYKLIIFIPTFLSALGLLKYSFTIYFFVYFKFVTC